MKTWTRFVTVGAAIMLLCSCVAQAQPRQAPSVVANSVSIEDIAWLAGRWVGDGLGGQMEEAWAPPVGAQMVGHFRLVQDGQPSFYELMLLDEFEGGVRMRVKHFNPAFVGWEEKDAWHTFEFVSAAPGVLRLDGLELRRNGADQVTMLLTLRQADGSIETETLSFHRAPL